MSCQRRSGRQRCRRPAILRLQLPVASPSRRSSERGGGMAWRTRTSAIAQPMVTGLSQQDAARDKNGGARGPADPTIHSMLEWNPHVSKPRGENRTENHAWKIRVAALPRRRRHGASPSAATLNSGQDAFEAAFIWRSKASAPITCSQPCTTAGDSPWSQAREPEDRVPRRATDRDSNRARCRR